MVALEQAVVCCTPGTMLIHRSQLNLVFLGKLLDGSCWTLHCGHFTRGACSTPSAPTGSDPDLVQCMALGPGGVAELFGAVVSVMLGNSQVTGALPVVFDQAGGETGAVTALSGTYPLRDRMLEVLFGCTLMVRLVVLCVKLSASEGFKRRRRRRRRIGARATRNWS